MSIFNAITGKDQRFTDSEMLYFDLLSAFRSAYPVADRWIIKTERVLIQDGKDQGMELMKASILKDEVVFAEAFSDFKESVISAERTAVMEALFCLGILPIEKSQ